MSPVPVAGATTGRNPHSADMPMTAAPGPAALVIPTRPLNYRQAEIPTPGRAPPPQPDATPPLHLKLVFWFVLSAFSVFFAEVVSGSYPLPFFNPFMPWDLWGWLVLMPLYGLHTLVLASVIFAWGRPRFSAVFLAGAIFGLYEAYITKVLWQPTWGPPVVSGGGIAIVELVVITLWWHPFMSFAVPLAAAETVLTPSREVVNGLPPWTKRLLAGRGPLLLVLFALWAGAVHGGPNIVGSLFSSLISMAFLLVLVVLWYAMGGAKYPMRALLPTPRQAAVLTGVLVALYIVLGANLLRERIPGPAAQAPIWALYALFFLLLYKAIRRSGTVPDGPPPLAPIIRWKWLLAFAAIFTAASAVVDGASVIILVISWAPGAAIGLASLAWSVRETIGRPPPLIEGGPPGGNSQS